MSMHLKFIKGEQEKLHGRDLTYVSEISWTWSLQNPTGSVTVGFQLLLMLFSGEGERGPTDCSHSLLLQRCSRLHQSCTQAFTSICTWELSESRIWSTIIPAQKKCGLLKRRNNICVIDVGNISAAPQVPEETVTLFSVLSVEIIQTELGSTSWVLTFPTELMLYRQFCAHEAHLNKNRLFKKSLQRSVFWSGPWGRAPKSLQASCDVQDWQLFPFKWSRRLCRPCCHLWV